MNDFLKRLYGFAKWRAIRTGQSIRHARVHDSRAPNAVWEIHTLRQLFDKLPIDCVFDVGANCGAYAQMLRRDVGYKGHLVSFEPIPELGVLLRRISRADDKWHIAELAVSTLDGNATFNVMENSEFSSLHAPLKFMDGKFDQMNSVEYPVTVKTATLKSCLEKYQKELGFQNPMLKLDTQGHNFEILSASKSLLRNFVAIQTELSYRAIYSHTASWTEVLALLESCDFPLSALIQNNAGFFPVFLECDALAVRKDIQSRLMPMSGNGIG